MEEEQFERAEPEEPEEREEPARQAIRPGRPGAALALKSWPPGAPAAKARARLWRRNRARQGLLQRLRSAAREMKSERRRLLRTLEHLAPSAQHLQEEIERQSRELKPQFRRLAERLRLSGKEQLAKESEIKVLGAEHRELQLAFAKLLGLRPSALRPGSPKAQEPLEEAETGEHSDDDVIVEMDQVATGERAAEEAFAAKAAAAATSAAGAAEANPPRGDPRRAALAPGGAEVTKRGSARIAASLKMAALLLERSLFARYRKVSNISDWPLWSSKKVTEVQEVTEVDQNEEWLRAGVKEEERHDGEPRRGPRLAAFPPAREYGETEKMRPKGSGGADPEPHEGVFGCGKTYCAAVVFFLAPVFDIRCLFAAKANLPCKEFAKHLLAHLGPESVSAHSKVFPRYLASSQATETDLDVSSMDRNEHFSHAVCCPAMTLGLLQQDLLGRHRTPAVRYLHTVQVALIDEAHPNYLALLGALPSGALVVNSGDRGASSNDPCREACLSSLAIKKPALHGVDAPLMPVPFLQAAISSLGGTAPAVADSLATLG
ncbi:unnamed protein product [Effrenium voratum]|nr:unnamed protein product [Effrenium voratum]